MKRMIETAVGLAAAAALTALPLAHSALAATQNVDVTVNAAADLGQIPSTAYGLNTAAWDGYLTDPAVPPLLRNLDVGMLRFPGGSTSDEYDWETDSIVPGQSGYVNPNDTFDAFMQVDQAVGAQPIITVNYGSNFAGTGGGEPSEAAAWVQYADVTHHDNVEYWEIGNEVYGDQTYGGDWEVDLHANQSPQTYATNALQYIQAMRAVDPNIKIGVVLTLPYNWPWGVNPNWNQAVLQTDGPYINFVVVHWYPQNPGSESDSALLADTNQVPAMLSELKSEISQWAGSNASNIQIFLDETNSVSSDPGKQTTSIVNALFLDNDFMSWLRGGVANVSWWDLHNGITAGNASSALYGTTQYGDYGLLSNGSSIDGMTEPPAETPFPTYYGYQMLTTLGRPGDTMVAATSNQSLVDAYAVRQQNGNLAVMVDNTDPSNSYTVNLSLAGFRESHGPIQEYSYGAGDSQVMQSWVPPGQPLTVAPYTVATFVLHGAGVSQPPGVFSRVSQSTTVAANTVTPGATEAITTTFTDGFGMLHNATLDVEVYNSSGQQVGQDLVPGITLRHGQSDTVTYDWTAPNAQDTYTVKTFAFSQDLTQTYLADQAAATFVVAAPPTPNAFTESTTMSVNGGPSSSTITAAAGSTVTIDATFTNTSTNNGYLESGELDSEVHDVNNNKVGQGDWVATLAPGQSITETWQWEVPPSATTGSTYTLQGGVFSSGWSTNYSWDSDQGTITVGS